jgi:hypothetical protein
MRSEQRVKEDMQQMQRQAKALELKSHWTVYPYHRKSERPAFIASVLPRLFFVFPDQKKFQAANGTEVAPSH